MHRLTHHTRPDGTPYPDIECRIDAVFRTGEAVMAADEIMWRADGASFPVEYRAVPLHKDGHITGAVVTFLDTTERQRARDELIRASKLESVGMLAGGIAHDFNNLLAAIVGQLSLAKLAVDGTHTVLARLEEAQRAALRAQGLTRQLLTFATGGQPVKQTVSIGRLLRETAEFALRGSTVTLECSVPDGLWTVEADEGQIAQILHNLLLNAQQAMPQGGVIRLRAENVTIGSGPEASLKPGRYVKISVADQGGGIPPALVTAIFDPFFSTKPSGTGLGLTTSLWIAKRHEGHLTVHNRPGHGAIFLVYLPRSLAVPPLLPEEAPLDTGGSGRVLLMDDEAGIRESGGDMLRYLGYEVECAEHGADAISRFVRAREEGRPFDVVILDLTIRGGLGGTETFARLREIDPAVVGLVSSGYSHDAAMARYREAGFAGAVPKPYTVETLSRVMRSAWTPPDR